MIKLYYYKEFYPEGGLLEDEALRETPNCWVFNNKHNYKGEIREFKEAPARAFRYYRTPQEAHAAFIEYAEFKINRLESELNKWAKYLQKAKNGQAGIQETPNEG